MASKAQVAAKVKRLGGSLIVEDSFAYLNAPDGFMFDGYHYVSDGFDEGRQSAWDYFWSIMKNMHPCTVENCECAGDK